MLESLLKSGQPGVTNPQESVGMPLLPPGETGVKIRKYQEFMEEKLKPGVVEHTKARDAVYQELGQYRQLRTTV